MRKETSTNFINNSTLESYCNAHKVFSKISGRWKLSIIFALSEQHLLFSEFKLVLPNITDRILAKQLKELTEDRLIKNEKSKVKSVYSLTENGKEIMSILVLLRNFDLTSV